ncbi:MAG: hypothetical protein NVS2B11_15920 [Acetobacteraceae bacterium]
MKHVAAALVAAWLLVAAPVARAADDVVIGAIYPLTGNAAQIGADARAAMDTMLEIINTTHAKVPMLMGGGGGLDRMGGAKIRIVYADHQNDPQKARAEAERLITQDKVSAIIGSYTSATAATISQVAERYEVPYLSVDNSSPSLNKRGLKWFFRTTPHDEMFTAAMFDFFKQVGAKTGHPVKSVALFYEDSIFGTDSSGVQRRLAGENQIQVLADIKYRANSPSLSAAAAGSKASVFSHWRSSIRSRQVSAFAHWSVWRIAMWNGISVFSPLISYSCRARTIRRVADSRSASQTISLAIIGS